jgi:hypothetical protein
MIGDLENILETLDVGGGVQWVLVQE